MSTTEIKQLATTLSRLLQENGVTRYYLHYTGSDDSTDGCSTEVDPREQEEVIDAVETEVITRHSRYDSTTQTWQQTGTPTMFAYEDAAYHLAELLWEHAGQGGWYNNEGGFGELTILPTGTIEFRHVNYLNHDTAYNDETEEYEDVEQEESEMCHWRFNVLIDAVINTPYNPEETPHDECSTLSGGVP